MKICRGSIDGLKFSQTYSSLIFDIGIYHGDLLASNFPEFLFLGNLGMSNRYLIYIDFIGI